MARDRETDVGLVVHGHRGAVNQRPRCTRRGTVCAEDVALTHETQPHGRRCCSARRFAAGMARSRSPLEPKAIPSRHVHEGVPGIVGQRLPNHETCLGPRVHVLKRRDLDADIEITGGWLVGEMKLVGPAAHVRARANDRESTSRARGVSSDDRAADVAVAPSRWQCRSLRGRWPRSPNQRAHESKKQSSALLAEF